MIIVRRGDFLIKRRSFTREFKLAAVNDVVRGLSYAEVEWILGFAIPSFKLEKAFEADGYKWLSQEEQAPTRAKSKVILGNPSHSPTAET